MSPFDLIVIVIVVGLGLLGFKRGFVKELIETVGAVIAAMIAYRYHTIVAQWFNISLNSNWWAKFAVFFGTFLVVMIIIAVVGHLLKRFIKSIHLGMYDRLAGFMLGGIKGGIVVAAISLALLWIGPIGNEVLAESGYARANLMVFHLLSDALPDSLKEKYSGLVNGFSGIAPKYDDEYNTIPVTVTNNMKSYDNQMVGHVIANDSITHELVIEYTTLDQTYSIDVLKDSNLYINEFDIGAKAYFKIVYVPKQDKVYAYQVHHYEDKELTEEETEQ